MSTPFASLANCTLTLEIETWDAWNDTTLDYGKSIKPLLFVAMIKPKSRTGIADIISLREESGVDTKFMQVEGRLIKPKQLPIEVKLPTTGKVLFKNGSKGILDFNSRPPSPAYNEISLLGQYISGKFYYE